MIIHVIVFLVKLKILDVFEFDQKIQVKPTLFQEHPLFSLLKAPIFDWISLFVDTNMNKLYVIFFRPTFHLADVSMIQNIMYKTKWHNIMLIVTRRTPNTLLYNWRKSSRVQKV